MPGATPIYGFPYPDPSDLVANYPALGQDLAEDIEAVLPTLGGLSPATPTTIANSGGSASLTENTVSFSGVSSVSLNGCFTTDYENYRVLIWGTASSSNNVQLRMRLAGSDASTSAYNYGAAYISTGAAAFETGATAQTVAFISRWISGVNNATDIEMANPAIAADTNMTSTTGNGGSRFDHFAYHDVATAYDGFSIIPGAGTLTGSIAVYGYKK
jgi:hypothetical protein